MWTLDHKTNALINWAISDNSMNEMTDVASHRKHQPTCTRHNTLLTCIYLVDLYPHHNGLVLDYFLLIKGLQQLDNPQRSMCVTLIYRNICMKTFYKSSPYYQLSFCDSLFDQGICILDLLTSTLNILNSLKQYET